MARRPAQRLPAQQITLTPDGIRTGISRLIKRREELERFDVQSLADWTSPELNALATSIKRALAKTFGENTSDYERFSSAGDLAWNPGILVLGGPPTPMTEVRRGVGEHIANAVALLNEAIRTLREDLQEMGEPLEGVVEMAPATSPQRDVTRVFVVHGHDGESRQAVARFVERLGFEAVILHERPNKGRTIITKFREEAAGVGFAVVLMTPDDVGGPSNGSQSRPRARQNVVFELGFFIGALGSDRVAALVKGDIERPSDFDGVVYISLENADWPTQLGRELEAADYHIDWNKVMR